MDSNHDNKEESKVVENTTESKETWRIWDAVFISGIFSLFNDSMEAKNDVNKFKQSLYQLLFAVVFLVLFFAIVFRGHLTKPYGHFVFRRELHVDYVRKANNIAVVYNCKIC
ncbi:hypothetical protein ACIQ2D_03385 [Lysinibacillus sp. NPDC097287]|uniref:hypothetical protein n=1 Tax=Lysinibacillus sp. NPDC097287 TaxID=3364144 RepID=UPI0038255298